MDYYGFIGYGSMGSMLIKGLVSSGQVTQEQIIVTRKDKNRLKEIQSTWPEVQVMEDTKDVARKARYIFLCIKPSDYLTVLDEIKSIIQPDQHMISINGTVTLGDIESKMNCKISKYMPTLVSEVKGGISLICHNDKVNLEEADFLEQLLGCISKVKHTEEKDFEFLSDLTSCGPGLIAALFQELADAAYRRSDNFAMDEIEEILLLTLYGTSDLMLKKKMNFGNVISRVATKGGITEEGVKVIHNELPPVFDEMFAQILKKRKIVSERIQSQLKGDLG